MTTVDGNGEVMMTLPNITPAAHFVGDYNPNLFYDYGAICMKHSEMWVFDGARWHQITDIETNIHHEKEVKNYITHCPNCGAPMQNHKCMYCGTEDYGRR